MVNLKKIGGVLYKLLLRLTKFVMHILFKSDIETLKDVPKPFIILSNHTTDFDCAFIAVAAQAPVSFVATENILRMGFLGRFAAKTFDPIIHYKGTMGLATTKHIIQSVRDGKNVAMFPEGNRSFNGLTCPIPPATAKLARISQGTLVTYKLKGGYFSSPRWASTLRKGRITGRIAGIYSPEALKKMSPEEIQKLIENDLQADAYEEQRDNPTAFRGKKRAEHLESTLFMCPACEKIGSMKSCGNFLTCECGFMAEYDEYGMLNSSQQSYTITELDQKQRDKIEKLCKENGGDIFFEDEVYFQLINEKHGLEKTEMVVLSAYRDRFSVGETVIPFEKITGIAINQRNLLLIHTSDISGHYEVSGEASFNALKYLYLYRTICGSRNGLL